MVNNVWIFDSCKSSKTRFSCKCYTNGQIMNMYTLNVNVIHGPSGKVMLSHDLWLDVGSNFIYATKVILIVNVGCQVFYNCKLTFLF